MTPNEAKDEILAVFKTSWDDTGYTAIYTDVPGSVPSEETPWARVTLMHLDGKQSSLSGENGNRRFANSGLLTVQIFTPIGDGGVAGSDLVYTLMQAYSRTRGQVWYLNPRMREVGKDGAFEQTNFLVDFNYDDLR